MVRSEANRVLEQGVSVGEEMTQVDLELEPRCKIPPRGTQVYEILMYLKSGGRLTVAKALSELGVYALSQRCGELRRQYGWPIKSINKKVGTHVWVSEYFLVES
jgi:hypothetical protein